MQNIYIYTYMRKYLNLDSDTQVTSDHKSLALTNICNFFGLKLNFSKFFGVKIIDSDHRYLKLSINTINLLFKFVNDCHIKINTEKNYSEECAAQNKSEFKILYRSLCEDLDLPPDDEQCLKLGDEFLFLISHRNNHILNNYTKCINVFLDFINDTLAKSQKIKILIRNLNLEKMWEEDQTYVRDLISSLVEKNNFYLDILLKELIDIFEFFFIQI